MGLGWFHSIILWLLHYPMSIFYSFVSVWNFCIKESFCWYLWQPKKFFGIGRRKTMFSLWCKQKGKKKLGHNVASNSFFIVWMDISRMTIYANIPNIFIQKQLLTILISLFLPTIPLVQDSFVLLHVFQDGYCAKFHQAIKKKKVWHLLWRSSITIVQLCLNVSPLRWPAGSHAQ